MTYRQDPPNCIQVEATEGCNLRCSFCGIRGIREAGTREDLSGPYLFMSPVTARAIGAQAAAAGWNPRIEFAMHGEPTQNPKLPRLIQEVRAELPGSPIMVTTNGIPLLDGWRSRISDLFDAGANTIAVDNYRPYRCEGAVLGTSLPGVDVYRYPQERAGSPHRRPRKGERRLVLVQDISQATEGSHAHLSNHAGAAGEKDYSRANQRCALPFREIAVRWDGSVALCCNDWRGAYKIGNVHKVDLSTMWQGPEFMAARRKLYAGDRGFGPCDGCNHSTYRNGLLPDRMGKEELPPPGAGDDLVIDACLSGEPFTTPVKRRWELPVVEAK